MIKNINRSNISNNVGDSGSNIVSDNTNNNRNHNQNKIWTIPIWILAVVIMADMAFSRLDNANAATSLPALSAQQRQQVIRINSIFHRAVQRALPAVVYIRVSGGKGKNRSEALGSGCIIDARGYVITNNHVVAHADKIDVVLTDGRHFKAQKKMLDPDTDLAIVKITPGVKPLPVAQFGDSDKLQVGDFVMAMGCPFGLTQTVTLGIVSYKGRQTHILGQWGYEDFIQTDAEINQGNSGGPLVNLYGEIVGINSNILSPNSSRTSVGYGFAIPSKLASYVAKTLIKYGKVTRGYLGVSMSSFKLEELQSITDDQLNAIPGLARVVRQMPKSLHGVLVMEVMPDTPAMKAGLKKFDVFIKINNKPMTSSKVLRDYIAHLAPGMPVKCLIWRAGKKSGQTKQITITLTDRNEAQKKFASMNTIVVPAPGLPQHQLPLPGTRNPQSYKLGLSIVRMTGQWAAKFGYKPDPSKVIIVRVSPAGQASRSHLKPGDIILSVNGHKVNTTEQVKQFIEQSLWPQFSLKLSIQNKTGRHTIIIRKR